MDRLTCPMIFEREREPIQEAGRHRRPSTDREVDAHVRHVPAVETLRAGGAVGPIATTGTSRIRRAASGELVIRRAYVKGSAVEDAKLFDKSPPVDKPLDTAAGSRAAKFGITAGNMAHYLERHTYKYQRLNAKTIDPAASMFPHGTTADDVKKMLDEALKKLPDSTVIGTTAVSTSVDLDNGLKVNLGALKSGKLSAFFPISGTGCHNYSADELKAIRDAKNSA
jgi:hypothetical protein